MLSLNELHSREENIKLDVTFSHQPLLRFPVYSCSFVPAYTYVLYCVVYLFLNIICYAFIKISRSITHAKRSGSNIRMKLAILIAYFL